MSFAEAFGRAVEAAGTETELGRKIGVTQNAIWQVKQRGSMTAEMAMKIEAALAGAVLARDLCPDLPWPNYGADEAPGQEPESVNA
jgi:DNA-binding transcriptional regulator YdaS (Cro superfamily)